MVSIVEVVCLREGELGVEVGQKEAWGMRLWAISDSGSETGPESSSSCLCLVIPSVRGMCTSNVKPQPRVFVMLRIKYFGPQAVICNGVPESLWSGPPGPMVVWSNPNLYISLKTIFPAKGWDNSDVVADVGE